LYPDLVKLLNTNFKDITGGILHIETDPIQTIDAILFHIENNREKLGN
jgi:carbon-monoxide dehydrogenase catalytic subunit